MYTRFRTHHARMVAAATVAPAYTILPRGRGGVNEIGTRHAPLHRLAAAGTAAIIVRRRTGDG